MRWRGAVLVAGLLAVGGCVKKAAYIPDGRGGYLLQTQATSLDQAMERFQRTASGLCPNEDYELGEPRAGKQTGTAVMYDVDLDCSPP
jgi:hypothetical protein